MKPVRVCRDGVPFLVDYLEGTLAMPVRRAIDRHVGSCRRCQGFVRSYVATPAIVRRATAVTMPESVRARLRGSLAIAKRGTD